MKLRLIHPEEGVYCITPTTIIERNYAPFVRLVKSIVHQFHGDRSDSDLLCEKIHAQAVHWIEKDTVIAYFDQIRTFADEWTREQDALPQVPPGPWTCIRYNRCLGQVSDATGAFAFTIETSIQPRDQDNLAIMALVTAAPELLAAAKSALESIDKGDCTCHKRDLLAAAIERAERSVL